MTLDQNNFVQLWRKAEADSRDVVNLFLAPPAGDQREQVFAILKKLRSAQAAMQHLERMAVCGVRKD